MRISSSTLAILRWMRFRRRRRAGTIGPWAERSKSSVPRWLKNSVIVLEGMAHKTHEFDQADVLAALEQARHASSNHFRYEGSV